MANQRTDTQAVVNLVINGRQAQTTLRELTDTQRRLNSEMRNMRPNDPQYPARLRELRMINTAIREQRREMQGLNTESSNLRTNWKDIAKGIISVEAFKKAAEWIGDAVSKVVDGYAQMQKSRAILTNAFNGDAKLANSSLKMLQDFAAKTPYALQEATEGFIKLVNRGIIPTQQEMVKLGDLAASQGKGLDQLIEAILDAQTGENERLKDFGIKASKNGDTVSFSFKGITKEVKNTDEAIRNAILSFGDMDGVRGVMDTVSKGIVGLKSNISDTADQIYTKIGQNYEGLINKFYQTYASFLGYINEELLATESLGQRMTKQFKDQALEVNRLEKNLSPLLSRYDELKEKSSLNTSEQTELKNILSQVALTLPEAVTAWDQYGNALDINTQKAKGFIDAQRAMLVIQNKGIVDQLQKEIKDFTKTRDNLLKQLNSGKTLESSSPGSGGASTLSRQMTQEEYQKVRDLAVKYNDLIKLNKDAISGFNGDYMADILKKQADEQEKSQARTEGVIQKEITALKALRAEQDVHSKSYAEYTAKISKLEDELNTALGKKTSDQKSSEKLAKKEKTEAEKLASDIDKIAEDLLQKSLDKKDQEIEAIRVKYQELRNRAKGNKERLIEIANLEGKEAMQLYDKYSKEEIEEAEKKGAKLAEERKKAVQQIQEAGLSGMELELFQTDQHYKELLALAEKFGLDVTQVQEKWAQAREKIQTEEAEKSKKKKEAERREIRDAAVGSAQEVASSIFEIGANNRRAETDAHLRKLESERDRELSNKSLTEEQKAEINRKYDEKVRAEKRRAWKADQKAALTQAVISGALAVVRALPNIALSIAAGVAAAAQIAVISSQKPPEFAKGVSNFAGGPAVVGEAGMELIEEDGRWWLTRKPQLTNLAPGANVYSAGNTSQIMDRTLGERLYPPVNYSIAGDSIREAERAYRYGGSNGGASTVSAQAAQSTPAPVVKINNDALEKKLDELIDAVGRGLVFDYKGFEEFKGTIDTARSSQTG